MTLITEWKSTLKSAWSVRWIIAAAMLSGLEVAMPMLRESLEPLGFLPPGTFAVTSAIASAASVVARVLAQPEKK
jgi:hypothetical protein